MKKTEKKTKVMIIDDDSEFLCELKEILEAAGYDVTKVSDNARVIKTAAKVQPDIILIDLKMYPKSGFQLADELRTQFETSKTPIISMSGYFTREEDGILRGICGIQEQVDKPFNPLDVITVIERVTGGKRTG
ncbi:MAG: response regulator [Candidatus Omnitrophica bacterium]|nr:response regulator [Candidatus Omnitrophota bacterium]